MARPEKNNLDYFSHDCDMRNDIKVKALRRKYGHKGYSIYLMMLEHLGNCNYLQYEWNELSIELLTPDFDIDAEELKTIIDYCVFLNLFQVEEGIIYNQKFYDRNQEVLNKRKSFFLGNSPLSVLKRNKLPDNRVNSTLTIVNSELIHKEEYSKEEESKKENNKEEYSKEEQIKRKYIIKEKIKSIFKTIPDIDKLIDRNDMDTIERKDKYNFNLHYSTLLEYQRIKI